ncbi:MAG TPA: HD domain-containing phosphohydrolase [Gemmatimonadaceae bacterium]|nr:HD domain-containing phosphohydrolase [Gemmatimonadaceae bacterium]
MAPFSEHTTHTATERMTSAAATEDRPRVLCVDDDPDVLKGLERVLGNRYRVTPATCAGDALTAIRTSGEFSVVISDLRLPQVNGVELLARIRTITPDTVRVLLTGQAEIDDAVGAINDGQIFSFIRKPCRADQLLKQIDACVQQFKLLTDRRELLERTLHGSIRALTDLLALTCPEAFGRATRLKRYASDLAAALQVENQWQIEVAAMLSQIGCATLSPSLVERMHRGEPLERAEQALVDRLPAIAEDLLAAIPRLEPVREIIRHQRVRFDGVGSPGAPRGQHLPIGSRILKLVADFDTLDGQGIALEQALQTLGSRAGWYDSDALRAFAATLGFVGSGVKTTEMRLADVTLGMVFGADVITPSGVLLVARGQDVTPSLLARIQNHWVDFAGKHRVKMIPRGSEARPMLASA